MSIYHSPACRITDASVMQGSRNDQAFGKQSFALKFTVAVIDPNIWLSAGYVRPIHTILRNGQVVREWGGATWIGSYPQRHLTAFWTAVVFSKASDAVPTNSVNPFLYRPSITFEMWGPGGSDLAPVLTEFAVIEEDHYFSIDIAG